MEEFMNTARRDFQKMMQKRKEKTHTEQGRASWISDVTGDYRNTAGGEAPGSVTMTRGAHEPLFRPSKSSTPHVTTQRGYVKPTDDEDIREQRRKSEDKAFEEMLQKEIGQQKVWTTARDVFNSDDRKEKPPHRYDDEEEEYRPPWSSGGIKNPREPEGKWDMSAYDTTHMLAKYRLDVFGGEKRHFNGWWAMFDRLVNQNPKLPLDIKFLMLKNSLNDIAAKAIQNLPQSQLAYEIALTRLHRKFGGRRRDMSIRLCDLTKFRQVRDGHATDLEKFAELLEGLVISLSEAGEEADMSGGPLYHMVQQKLTETTLTRYNHWRKDKVLPPTVHSLRSFVNAEAEGAMEAWETAHGMGSEKPLKENRDVRTRTSRSFVTQDTSTQNKNWKSCVMCKKEHPLWKCEQFQKLSVKDRWEQAKVLRTCFRCLSVTHRADKCQANRVCNVHGCKLTHHWLLHDEERVSRRADADTDKKSGKTYSAKPNTGSQGSMGPTPGPPHSSSTGHDDDADNSHHRTMQTSTDDVIALRTVPVFVCANGRKIQINALLDDGSTRSYVNENVASQLMLSGTPSCLTVNTLNNQKTRLDSSVVEFTLESLDGAVSKTMFAYTTRQVTGQLIAVDWSRIQNRWTHLKEITFPQMGQYKYVDLLIGLDMLKMHDCEVEVHGEEEEPVARLTPLGWTCVGCPDSADALDRTHFTFCQFAESPSEAAIKRFWEIPEDHTEPYSKPEDRDAMKQMQDSLQYTNGRYCIGLPWATDKPTTNNFQNAKNRMTQLRKKLLRNPEMGLQYTKVLQEYEQKNYIKELSITEVNMKDAWFLPHFAVSKPDRETTKYRVVFDGAAKDGSRCLNDYLLTGPKLQQELLHVLMRFRRYAIGVVCDISQMYLQILLRESDQPYHRFVWQGTAPEAKLQMFQFLRNLFGARCSPGMAHVVAKTNAELHQEKYPRAAETVLSSTYMDDSMDSVQEDEEAIRLYHDLRDLWAKAGMDAKKWLSNSRRLMEHVPKEDRTMKVDITAGDLPHIKTLGVMWQPQEDVFVFNVEMELSKKAFTKRTYLSLMSTLFDPMGFVSPVTIQAKILFQRVWTLGLGWDEFLPREICEQASQWFESLTALQDVQVSRPLQDKDVLPNPELHVFTDASLDAYGAVVYLRGEYTSEPTVRVRFVVSRSRVTPLHSVSVPKLELMAAVVGVKAAEKVGTVLQIPMERWKFWVDSLDVLYWIRGRSREFKPFVGNRIGVIQMRSIPSNWQHVGTNINPADKITRGIDADKLAHDQLWWQGPPYLLNTPDQWPQREFTTSDTNTEKRKKYNTELNFHAQVAITKCRITPIGLQHTPLDTTRFSSLHRLTRVLSYVLRFIKNCMTTTSGRTTGVLHSFELEAAHTVLIRYAQYEGFSRDVTTLNAGEAVHRQSVLASMKPWIDQDGIIRSQSRLSQATYLPFDQKYPILLPRRHSVTALLVRQHHEKSAHGGTNRVFYSLSEKYWIFSARELIREVEHSCMHCRRKKARPEHQQMAPLPSHRLDASYQAFETCSVDFGGPYLTKQGRGRIRTKRYLCLFACVQVRAVHLEIAYGLDTSSFLNALNRMISRRGAPKMIISDNGTNFTSGNRELQLLWKEMDQGAVEEKTAGRGIKWDFNPPASPHFNGLHESLIKSAKHTIRELLVESVLSDEELTTVFCQAEYLLNSRPLTYQSSHPDDLRPLTPNHFLTGIAGKNITPESADIGGKTLAAKWRSLQQLNRTFWERWVREWVSSLSGRSKWRQETKNVAVGDVVIMASPDAPRGHWPLGRVTAVFPGKDGLVRTADVRVGDQTYRRPIVKLCILDVQ